MPCLPTNVGQGRRPPSLRDWPELDDGAGCERGAGAEYDFTAQNHTGITKNPFLLAQFINGKDVLVK